RNKRPSAVAIARPGPPGRVFFVPFLLARISRNPKICREKVSFLGFAGVSVLKASVKSDSANWYES
ncbi:MAG TPA: hypothetical protein PKW96_08160, partial [Candidatus Aminicenantes bacterium]|nr:hypothetical protein [Candidatus Aminicenantes bacterium]